MTRSARVAFTLVELMISMSIFSIATLGLISLHLFGQRHDQLVLSKLGASDQSRRAFDRLTEDIRAATSLNADLCRAWLSVRLSDLIIQEEFSLTAARGSGPAFDLICKVDGVVRASRVAFIASPIGVLEFNGLTSPERFEEAKAQFRSWLRGFRISDATGQLETLSARGET